MPNALAHVLFSALVSIIFVSVMSGTIEQKVISGVLVIVASFIPDIDHKNATARNVYRNIGGILSSVMCFVFLTVFGVWIMYAIIISIVFGILFIKTSEIFIPKHRGIMHSIWFAIIIGSISYLLLIIAGVNNPQLYTIAIVLGYTSHIFLDNIL